MPLAFKHLEEREVDFCPGDNDRRGALTKQALAQLRGVLEEPKAAKCKVLGARLDAASVGDRSREVGAELGRRSGCVLRICVEGERPPISAIAHCLHSVRVC